MAQTTFSYKICRWDGWLIGDNLLPYEDFSTAKKEAKRLFGNYDDLSIYVYEKYDGEIIDIWQLNNPTGHFVKA